MKDDGPLLQDTTASAKLLGAEANLIPFLQSTSAQRVSMSSQHIAHSLPPKRPEHAYIYTGYETIMGHYDFNQTKRDQDVYIIDVIPKYPENKGQYPLKVNPLFTVICIGKDDGLVHYFNMERYGKCTDGYGYRNEWMNTNYLQKDMLIPQDMEFSRATAHIGKSGYGMGVNANAAYITAPEVDNDAVWVSRSLANKFSTVAVSTIAGDIAANQYPLNRYGDAEEYKFLPDIGETVNRDGIICGFRTPTDNTFISDVLTLNTPCPQCDELYYAPPGAEIIDIEFYTGPSKNKIKTDPKLFSQVDKYVEPMYQYWSRIVKVYEEIRDKQYGISPEFNTLVTRCMAMLMSAGKFVKCVNKRPDMKLCAGKEQIEFIRFKVTYAYERPLQLAFKLTDRVGTKGVVSKISEDDEMPVDEQGVRCDIVFNPQAVPNRMSPSQLYETGINRITLFVQKQAIQLRRSESALKAVEYIVDYIKELNPAYAELKAGPVLLRDPESYMDYVESQDAINELGIFMMIPPFNKHITPEKIKHLKNKYNVITSPVTFVRTDPVTNTKERKTTKSNVCVSSKYVFVLYNIPQAKAPGVGHINQFKIPVKPNPKSKFMSPIGLTPLRIGEDEGRIMTMCAGPSAVTRLMGIHSNSFEAVGRTMETLLTAENPSKIERVDITDDEIRRTNNVVGVANHMMATMGIDMSHINCEVFDEVDFAANILSRDSGKF